MHLVQILLPLCDNQGNRFGADQFGRRREELTKAFGGVTTFTRAPAQGTTDARGAVVHDDIVVFEVMVERLDRDWWARYRQSLEQEFAQDEILIRASETQRL
jgi:hypothetical protein